MISINTSLFEDVLIEKNSIEFVIENSLNNHATIYKNGEIMISSYDNGFLLSKEQLEEIIRVRKIFLKRFI